VNASVTRVTDPGHSPAVSNPRIRKHGIAQMNAFRWLLQGLHESRRRNAERQIRRYAHLIESPQERDRRLEIAAAARGENPSWREAITSVVGAGA